MPSQDSFRLHDPGYVEQTGPNPRHPYQQRPITAVQPQPRRRWVAQKIAGDGG
jgi:hypothetical protein